MPRRSAQKLPLAGYVHVSSLWFQVKVWLLGKAEAFHDGCFADDQIARKCLSTFEPAEASVVKHGAI